MQKVMFLCTGNSCRSQMAEGFLRSYARHRFTVYSAGLLATVVHPRAISVMREAGIEISHHTSKEIDEDLLKSMDVVITLCTHAEDACPWTPPHLRRLHWPIRDPVGTTGTDEEIMREFRRARDEIREKVLDFIERHAAGTWTGHS